MPLIYRVMTRDGDKPMVGDTANKLGVRPNTDLPVHQGIVCPGTGGMSVGPSLRALPLFLVPTRLRHVVPKARGKDTDACWRMGEGTFQSGSVANGLLLRVDTAQHGVIEPANDVDLSGFQAAIADTRENWVIDEQ